jgi:hypothetical protein
VVENLSTVSLASAIRGGSELAYALLSADLPGTVRSAGWMLNEVRAEQLVSKAARAADVAPRMLEIQRRILVVQTRALARLDRMLAVARETERHAESIDRKTGGQLPAP